MDNKQLLELEALAESLEHNARTCRHVKPKTETPDYWRGYAMALDVVADLLRGRVAFRARASQSSKPVGGDDA